MAYKIVWSQTAMKDISGLERAIARRIAAKLEAASNDPHRFFEKLSGVDEGKLRIGDYRVIAQLIADAGAIIVERVGHRKNIYKKMG
ncbi:MAG: type II toxin-antitoxin system RelE/ParE family toxin [Candidatus Micrarchaeota archaeon]